MLHNKHSRLFDSDSVGRVERRGDVRRWRIIWRERVLSVQDAGAFLSPITTDDFTDWLLTEVKRDHTGLDCPSLQSLHYNPPSNVLPWRSHTQHTAQSCWNINIQQECPLYIKLTHWPVSPSWGNQDYTTIPVIYCSVFTFQLRLSDYTARELPG